MWGKVNTSLPGLISAKDLCKSTCTTSGNAQPQKFKRTRSSAPDRSSLLRDPRFVNELQYATFNSKSEMVICSKGFTRFSREVNAVWDKRKWRIRSDCMSSDKTWISDKCWQPVTSSFKVCRDVILGRQLPEDGEDGEVMLLPAKCFSSHPEKSRSKTSGRNKVVRWEREFPGKTFTEEKKLQYPEIHCDYHDSWCISCQLPNPKSSFSSSPRQRKSSRFWAYHGFTCPKDLLYFATILKPPQTFGDFTLPPVRRSDSNSVGHGKENQLFVKDNERPGAKSVTRPVK